MVCIRKKVFDPEESYIFDFFNVLLYLFICDAVKTIGA